MNGDFKQIEHPCLRRTLVPIYARPAQPADRDKATVSDTTIESMSYIFRWEAND